MRLWRGSRFAGPDPDVGHHDFWHEGGSVPAEVFSKDLHVYIIIHNSRVPFPRALQMHVLFE